MAGGIFDSGMFNPDTYTGDNGWLSALLRNPQLQGALGGPPAAMAAQPDQAALPAAATPTMGQTPPQFAAPASQATDPLSTGGAPGIGDRLMAGFQGFANAGSP